MLRKKITLAFLYLFSLGSLLAQTQQITGTVVSAIDSEPIIGANIRVKGQAGGTVTDIDGRFSLQSVANDVLVISYIGFRTMEINIKGKSALNIVMIEDTRMLNEVVAVGYMTQKKADLTGAVSVVSTESLKTTASTDPMRSLQGRIAGVTITTDGSPSGKGKVRIRGIGSINSGQDPLFVIDGVPTTYSLNSLNTNDIESMQVLRDAASASIYGSRAANGVIIITTKKGKENGDGKNYIDFSSNLTFSFYTSQSKMKLLNSEQYVQAMTQAAINDGLDPVKYASNFGILLTKNSDGTYSGSSLYDGYINTNRTMKYSNTDWLDEISRTGVFQNYDISFRRGSNKGTSMFSLGYKGNEGILKYTNFNSLSARMNTSYNLGKIVTVGENFTVTKSNYVDDPGVEQNALKIAPIVPVYEEDGKTFAGPVGGMSDRQNPMRQLYQNKDNNKSVWRIFGNAYVDIKPIKGLLLRSNFGIDYDEYFARNLSYTFHSDVVNNSTASVTVAEANDVRWNWSNTAQYDFKLQEHAISILTGMELYKRKRIDISSKTEGYDLETVNYMWPDASKGVQNAYGNQSGYALVSFFGKANYNYNDLYLASFTIRHDGSSRFGTNNRYATFPAVTLGWRISNEPFMASTNEWLNYLKIRASWGMTGNQEISNTARYGLYYADYGNDRVTGTAYDLNLTGSGNFPSGYRQTQATNNNLKWETAIQYNGGVDFELCNGAIYGSYDAYIKDVKDMLISPSYLGSKGEGGASWANGPDMRNWGMEFSLGYRKDLGHDFKLDISGNLDFYHNKVTYLPETATGSYAHTTKENLVQGKQPYGAKVGYVVDGIFQNSEEVKDSGQKGARIGGLKYLDLDENGSISSDDQTWIYDPVPDFSFGLNIILNYKKIDLSMFWQGVYGVDVWNDQKSQTDFWAITDAGSNKGTRVLKAWSATNTSSTIPALTTNNTADEGRSSTYFVENGSYMKLRSLQIGYDTSIQWLKKIGVSSSRVYVSGSNLLTLKSNSLTCSDPENPSWSYPLSSSISFGLQVSF